VVAKPAAFFDLDKTIIATSTSAAFSKPLYDGGVVTRADVLKSFVNHVQYLLGNSNKETTERLRKQLSDISIGWDVEKVKAIVNEAVAKHIDPFVYEEAVKLISDHKSLGHDVIIISASASELVEPIAKLLEADHFVATKVKIVDGKYTGEIKFYAYGEQKAEAMRELAETNSYSLSHSYAYTDSITDVPMLDAVGHGTVVNPDKALRLLAVEHGWEMARFKHPINLRAALADRVSAIPSMVATIPEHVGAIQARVSTIPDAIKENPKAAAIAAGAAGAAVAGIAIARNLRKG
jgi:HAD superfamily hydrolase (TIGR01490 family)